MKKSKKKRPAPARRGVRPAGIGLFLAACLAGGAAPAQTVRDVRARQRWPWNNLVDIDYAVEGATNSAGLPDAAGLYIRFEFEDPETGATREAAAFDGEPPLTDGVHRVTWDPGADGARLDSTGMVCRAVLGRGDPRLYMVVDLSGGGTNAANDRVDYLPAVPGGGWTDEYKTTKLVMRKAAPGTFMMGSPTNELGRYDNETRHQVTLTEPFYIGVFEVTQKQWERVTGNAPPSFGKGDGRPVEKISYNDIRGACSGTNWPASSAVDGDSFIGRIRARTGLAFDLPTEAQWEYACRAGTDTALNSGKDLSNPNHCPEMIEAGRYAGNRIDGKGGYSDTQTTVGNYPPNAWGLYDMHGNVWEWCLDWYADSLGTADATNPPGGETGANRVLRGGSWYNAAQKCRSASRASAAASHSDGDNIGFRLACHAPGEAAGVWTNRPGVCSSGRSAAFPMDVGEGIRTVSRGVGVEIAYSDRWGGGAPGGVAEVKAEGVPLTTRQGEREGVCFWTPMKTGINILTHTYGTNMVAARVFVPGGEPPNLCEPLADAGSAGFPLDMTEGVRPVPLGPVGGITWSDRWDGREGGTVRVTADGAAPTNDAAGEGVCAWLPTAPGINTLIHTEDGAGTLTAQFLVMKDVMAGRPYSFNLEEADSIAGPPPGNRPLYRGPYTWTAAADALPEGLSLSTNGVLSGIALCESGRRDFTATITDITGKSFSKTYPLVIKPGGYWMILR